jgi:hypothetical protein
LRGELQVPRRRTIEARYTRSFDFAGDNGMRLGFAGNCDAYGWGVGD